jgi:hypothetical protein
MADDPDATDDGNWLLEPPAPGRLHVHIEVGSDVDLSPEARGAIERLMTQIQDDEVMGFEIACGGLSACGTYSCDLGRCTPLTKQPNCWAYVHCRIAELF